MEVVNFLSMWVMVSLLCCNKCDARTDINSERLELLENQMETYTDRLDVVVNQMSIDKSELKIEQKRQMRVLKRQLKSKTRKYVTEVLSEIIGGDSLEDMIKSQVISEVAHLKKANNQMSRELYQVKKSLGQVEADNRMYKEALRKVELTNGEHQLRELNQKLKEQNDSNTRANTNLNRDIPSMDECSKCLERGLLTHELADRDHRINELNHTLNEHIGLCKSSNQPRIKETAPVLEATTQTSTVSSTTTSTPTTLTTRLTTSEPQEERSRILVAPVWLRSPFKLRQFNILTNSFDNYPYPSLEYYRYMIYVSKLNSLLIGLDNKIIISELNTSRFSTFRNNVRTHGMAADEGRGIVFLTTGYPNKSISSMTLHGNNFTSLVSLSGFNPLDIAINPEMKIVYACNRYTLFTVFYNGTGLRTLDSGNRIYTVTLDITNGLLYYSKQKKLMKMSLSTEIISEVTQFKFYIWHAIYYRNKVYYTSCYKIPGVLGEVDVGQNTVSYILQENVSGGDFYAMCLIP